MANEHNVRVPDDTWKIISTIANVEGMNKDDDDELKTQGEVVADAMEAWVTHLKRQDKKWAPIFDSVLGI